MVALVGPLRGFHVAQQRVHFGEGELAVGAHGAVAGHGGQQFMLGTLDHVAGVELGQFGQDRARQVDAIGLRQRHGGGADGQLAGADGVHVQAQGQQGVALGFGRGHFLRRGGEHQRDQQGLAFQSLVRHLGFQALVDHAFVGGVHVHDDQALGVFGQHIDAADLRNGAAQRPLVRVVQLVGFRGAEAHRERGRRGGHRWVRHAQGRQRVGRLIHFAVGRHHAGQVQVGERVDAGAGVRRWLISGAWPARPAALWGAVLHAGPGQGVLLVGRRGPGDGGGCGVSRVAGGGRICGVCRGGDRRVSTDGRHMRSIGFRLTGA